MVEHDELCGAIVVIGEERHNLQHLTADHFHWLAELGLAAFKNDEWQLTPAGQEILAQIVAGEDIPSLD